MKKLILLISILTSSQMIRATFEANGIFYNIISESDHTVEIRTGGTQTGAIYIPQQVTYDNYYYYTVIRVGDNAFMRREIISISLPNTITSIGENAFYMTGLTSFTVPKKVSSIASNAFLYCPISNYNVDPSNRKFKAIDGVLYSYDLKTLISYPAYKSGKIFAIPNGVENIGDNAFYWNYLSSITIPNTVKNIGYQAFMLTEGLTSLSIPSSVITIGKDICNFCWGFNSYDVDKANLKYSSSDGVLFSKDFDTIIACPIAKTGYSYQIPSEVKYIGENAFLNNANLSSVIIPNGVVRIGISAFGSSNITSIIIPNSVDTIENNAFNRCKVLTSINIPDNVKYIGKSAFNSCDSLKNVILPDNLNKIEEGTFSDCKKLASIHIPENATSIGDEAFLNCIALLNIQIPNAVSSIGENAFEGSAWLYGQSFGLIYINSLLYKYKGVIPANTSIEVKDGTTQICGSAFSGGNGLVSIKIPNTVQIIGSHAFSDCINLKNITLPNSLITIGNSAFNKSGITSLIIPKNAINFSTLGQCDSLKSVFILSDIKSIGDNAFNNCKVLSSIKLPASVTNIGNSAFSQCKALSSITIPDSVINIGGSAFNFCSNLKSITISSNVHQIGAQAFANCDALDSIRSRAAIPPQLGLLSFYGVRVNNAGSATILQVPTGSQALYKTADQWKDFVSINEVNFTQNYQVKITNVSCPNNNDGRIDILTLIPHKYILDIVGNNYSNTFKFSGTTYSLTDLPPDIYQLNFSVEDIDTLKQRFTVSINQPQALNVYKIKTENSHTTYSLSGAQKYLVTCNGKTVETQDSSIEVALSMGENNIKITTDKICQGVFEDKIFCDGKDQVTLFPNPSMGKITLFVSGKNEKVNVQITTLNGNTIFNQTMAVQVDRTVNIDISSFAYGSYLVKVDSYLLQNVIKLIKK